MFKNFQKLMYTDLGKIVISIILGLGLSSLFRKVCTGKKCLKFQGPPLDDLRKNAYKFDNKCLKFNEKAITCGSKPQSISFA